MPPLIITDSSYQFVPPHRGRIWPRVLMPLVRRVRRQRYFVTDVELRGMELLSPLIQRGDGVLLAPNHCRMADATVLQELSQALGQPFFTMASAHLFRGGKALRFVLRRMGGFSVYREGVDRQAVNAATDILAQGERPLVIFPEGALSYANERLNALMEGVSFIARNAARKISRQDDSQRKIHVVPVALRYLYQGDIRAAVDPTLRQIEERLTWRPGRNDLLVDRIFRIGSALLGLKETELLGSPQSADLRTRMDQLIDFLLQPLEEEWRNGRSEESVIQRVRELRRVMVPDMIESDDKPQLSADEMARRWRQLEDMSLAQALSLFPPGYLQTRPSVDRILETVELMAETVTGQEQLHGPMKAIIQIGNPLEVAPKRDRKADADPVMSHVERELKSMLAGLSELSPLYDPGTMP